MDWTEKHDVLLCREIIVSEPFKFKKGSLEKGKVWTDVAESLNSCRDLQFKVNQRSVRDRFALLQSKFKSKNSADERSSGTSVTPTELDELVYEVMEKENAAAENLESEGTSKSKMEADRSKAEEARKRAMERVGQTKRRQGEDGECQPKRKRRSGNETLEYLRERAHAERALREKELEVKKIELEAQARRAEDSQNQMSQVCVCHPIQYTHVSSQVHLCMSYDQG